MSKRRLGKGIDALLGEQADKTTAEVAVSGEASGEASGAAQTPGRPTEGIVTLPLAQIRPNPDQPRKRFSQEALDELAASIREKGVIQPIVVEAQNDESYQIIAGERRYRAAGMAGLTDVPVLIRTFTQSEKLEIALIENLQREDLNPIEEALAFAGLIKEHGWTQEELAQRLGVSRTAIANSLRLLKLPDEIRASVENGALSAGHARAVLSLSDASAQQELARRIETEGLSVREAEAFVANRGAPRKKKSDSPGGGPKTKENTLSPELQDISQQLLELFGNKVTIVGNNHEGEIRIDYYNLADLERLIKQFREGVAPKLSL